MFYLNKIKFKLLYSNFALFARNNRYLFYIFTAALISYMFYLEPIFTIRNSGMIHQYSSIGNTYINDFYYLHKSNFTIVLILCSGNSQCRSTGKDDWLRICVERRNETWIMRKPEYWGSGDILQGRGKRFNWSIWLTKLLHTSYT